MRIAILALFFIISVGCKGTFTPPEGFVKLEKSEKREGSLGFSFMTPKGAEWYEGFSPNTLMYFKVTDPSKLSFFAGASEVPFKSSSKTEKALLDYIKSYKNDWEQHKDRYKNVNLELTLDHSSSITCVNYKQQGEDHGAKNLGNNKFLILTNIGRVCLEPTEKNMLVDINYSSRSVSNLNIDDYNEEGNYFINSLVYIK